MGLSDSKKDSAKDVEETARQKTNAELFIDRIMEMFGEPDRVRMPQVDPSVSPVSVMFWHDFPEQGTLTSVTYGLSESDHPDWKNGKCELMLSLQTSDEAWGIGTAIFATEYRGKLPFAYGSTFTTDVPLSTESEMTGFLVFGPPLIVEEKPIIELPDYPVFLKGMYPIYPEEVEVYRELGLEKFWHHPNFSMHNVHRERITAE